MDEAVIICRTKSVRIIIKGIVKIFLENVALSLVLGNIIKNIDAFISNEGIVIEERCP